MLQSIIYGLEGIAGEVSLEQVMDPSRHEVPFRKDGSIPLLF